MGRRSRKSKRKMNSLFMALLLTAVMLIMSTYAWFSANREVSLTGITAKVKAAEGLQISLDGEHWASTIEVTKAALDSATGNNHQFPDELVPVSSDGTNADGNIRFWYGDVSSDGTYLSNVAAVDAESGGKYIAFDCYFKNSSSQATDQFQFNGGTNVALTTGQTNEADNGVQNTGLEYSVRTGLLLYSNTAALTAAANTVRGLQPGTPVATIWEPNFNAHIDEIVTNDSRIANATTAFNTLTLTQNSVKTKFENINVATAAENADLGSPKPMQTSASISSATQLIAIDGTTGLTLAGNKISKTRIYIWLEGQDPDCVDTASTGHSLTFTLNFTKPAVTSTGGGTGGGTGG